MKINRKRRQTASTRELGLDLAQIAARYLFGTDHLHYGYWPAGLPVEPGNLRRAQENYTDLLVSYIPAGVRTILDVGMGTGALAQRLLGEGYEVDCVSPSPYLTERARTLLGQGPCIFECRYEELQTERRYDLILFSESFQYIDLPHTLSVSDAHLREGGHLLICDFFRKDTPDRGPFGGGHPLAEFRRQVAQYPLLQPIADVDITRETAPNLDLTADLVTQLIAPARDRVFHWAATSYPLLSRALRGAFRRPLERAEAKYLSGQRSGANFQVYKSYRLLLFQNGGVEAPVLEPAKV
ncbi:MAG: methyltransferase domain-containing protein [Cytophagales bacterium]|nr:methyltransferase domain-containing protein [Armatimonadota bacterium]